MYISLYRRYRPQKFSEIVGQSAAVSVVSRAIESGAVGHAYLFSGPRGCGKTTVARLFAKAVNCPDRDGAEPCNVCQTCRSILEGNCLDVVEIDGASNNGVDEIRDLKERVALASFTCPYKIYIIDEVHMLSISAFNALLKTLEEPPERVIFILATTAPYKVPATIRSRCQHIPFHAMTPVQIVSRLQQVLASEGTAAQDEALWEIARNAEGGMRDALSLMEQAMALGAGNITRETVDRLLGGGSSSSVRQWVSLCHTEPEKAPSALEELFRSGAEPERFLSVLFTNIRNLWLQARWGERVVKTMMLSAEELEWLQKEKNFRDEPCLERLMTQIASLISQVRRGLTNDVLLGLLMSWILAENLSRLETPALLPEQVSRKPQPGLRSESPALQQKAPPLSPYGDAGKFTAPAPPKPAEPQRAVPQLGEKPAAPAATQAETAGSAAVAADVSGLTPVSGDLKELLEAKFSDCPQVAVPLCLADVLWISESQMVSVQLDADDRGAYESLKSRAAVDALIDSVRQMGRAPKRVILFCGGESESFSAGEPRAPSPLRTEPELPRPGAANETPALAKFEFKPESRPQPKREPPQRAGNEPLTAFLRNFMDGELLYCRPNENPEESESEEDE